MTETFDPERHILPSEMDQIRKEVLTRAEYKALVERAEKAERLLFLRTRQLKTCGDNWCAAAEQALAGSPNSLRIRIGMHREPPVDVVLSESRP